MNNFYVYVHRKLSNNEPFYVGKGKGRRAYEFSGRNSHWTNVKNKHGVKVEVVFDGLTEDEAYQLEIDTILEFRHFGYPLTNKTSGGRGILGLKHKEDSKTKISNKQIYIFVNKDGSVFRGTRLDLVREHNVERYNLSQLFSNTRVNSAGGWGFIRDNETYQQCLSRLNTARTKSKIDTTVYKFLRLSDNLEFSGTRYDLCTTFSLDQNEFCVLFSKRGAKRKSSQGWTVQEK